MKIEEFDFLEEDEKMEKYISDEEIIETGQHKTIF